MPDQSHREPFARTWGALAHAAAALAALALGAPAPGRGEEVNETPRKGGSAAVPEGAAGREAAAEAEPAVDPAAAVDPEAAGPPDARAAAGEPDRQVFDRLLVTGGPAGLDRIPGSADYLGAKELRRREHSDVHRILRQVPGVNIQEEEGFGLRPNIGMRGTGVERSQKITLLEDGVLIAPAPYSAPAAYYFPTAGRMEAIEVRKGSSAVRQGPFTHGGVLNLVSSAIPSSYGGRVSGAVGGEDTARLHARVGDSRTRVGWSLETYQLRSDGFKRLDGGGSTGVDLGDYVGKLRLASGAGARPYQALELKLGRTDQVGSETYLGLTAADFERTPYRRYAGSRSDRIEAEHEQIQLRYFLQPGPRFDLTATFYRNDFFRNWHKLQSVAGAGIAEILATPERFASELSVLRGEADDFAGALKTRNNRRDYYSHGFEAIAAYALDSGAVRQRFELGLRVHRDGEDRFQDEARWNMSAGRMLLAATGAPGSQSNRISEARATALFLTDEISTGRWTLSAGARLESIDFELRDFGRADPGRTGESLELASSRIDVLVPGVGASFAASDDWVLFAGVHRGFAPPGPGQSRQARAEESVNWEAGFRRRGRGLAAQVVGFWSDYRNLLGRDTLSSGGEGTGSAFNGGRVDVRGLEAELDFDPGRARGWRLEMPLKLAYTWTTARFRSGFETDFADWAPRVEAGDELPYLPRQQLLASAGVIGRRVSLFADLAWSSPMRTVAGRGPLVAEESTDELATADLSLKVRLRPGLELTAQVLNLTDETVLVARRPAGLRPGLPRSTLVGVSWEF